MFKVIRGLVAHKGKSYRKGDSLPETFTNKEGYKHVEWNGKGTGPTAKDKVAENAQIKKLQKEVAELKAKLANPKVEIVNTSSAMLDVKTEVTADGYVVMFRDKVESVLPEVSTGTPMPEVKEPKASK